MSEYSEEQTELFESLWERLPTQASEILGSEVGIGTMKLADVAAGSVKDRYIATLTTDSPQEVDIFLIFDVESAICFSGLLVMMQEKVIREKMARKEMVEDDVDAMGECVNQITSSLTEVLRDGIHGDIHLRFTSGDAGATASLEKYADSRLMSASGKLTIGSLHTGKVSIIIPEQLFTGVTPGSGGVELSSEEAAAIREVTSDAFGEVNSKGLILLPIDREKEWWEGTMNAAGLTFDISRDVHSLRRLCRQGEGGFILIDADACPSGGLPALTRLLSWSDVTIPVFLAASNPTRVHLVSCLAAGAASYFVKPIEGDDLRQRLEEALTRTDARDDDIFGPGDSGPSGEPKAPA